MLRSGLLVERFTLPDFDGDCASGAFPQAYADPVAIAFVNKPGFSAHDINRSLST
jgi:hypothetical protein